MLYEVITEQRINDEILLDKARVIEDTLASFGAPGKVVEVNPGPVITQFGVEPDYIDRITSYNVCYTKLLRYCKIGVPDC